jgi:uncharacterized membrane protein YccC
MSLSELVKDCKRNGNVASILEAGVDPATATYLADVVWPVVQAMAEEAAELEEDLAEAIEQTEDLLHAETAAYFAALVEVGRRLVEKVKDNPDPEVQQLAGSLLNIASQCEAVLLEITIPDADPDEDDDDEDEDDDEEDDDDDAK